MDTHNPTPWPKHLGKIVFNKRIWTRDIKDVGDGVESAMHSMIAVDPIKGEIRSKIVFRDCDGQIHYEFWVTRRRAHVDKALRTLYKIRNEINDFVDAFEKEAGKLDAAGRLK